MIIESVLATMGICTLLLDIVNTAGEQVKQETLRRRVAVRDGNKQKTVEACRVELLFDDEEFQVVNSPSSSREEKALAYVRAQERTQANQDWRRRFAEQGGEDD